MRTEGVRVDVAHEEASHQARQREDLVRVGVGVGVGVGAEVGVGLGVGVGVGVASSASGGRTQRPSSAARPGEG